MPWCSQAALASTDPALVAFFERAPAPETVRERSLWDLLTAGSP